MARYIDIEGAGIGKANREQFLVPEFADGWNAVLKILEKEPTADVVEVVRCKDCKCSEHCYPAKSVGEEAVEAWYCKIRIKHMLPNDFCSYGERRTDNDTL